MRPLLLLIALLFLAHHAWGQTAIASISFQDPELEPISTRLVSELANAGYKVRVTPHTAPSPCSAAGAETGGVERVQIALSFETPARQTVRATICHDSASGSEQTVVTESSVDVERFGVLVTEALNGLRARVPEAPSNAPNSATPAPVTPRGQQESRVSMPGASLSVGPLLVVDPLLLEPLLGPSVATGLPMASKLSLSMDVFASLTPWQVNDNLVDVSTRLVWVRAGPRWQWAPGPVNVATSFSAGPALTWATASAAPPRVGKADVAVGIVASVYVGVEYPNDSNVFLVADARASTLVPRVRIQLASERSDAFGRLLLEALLGMGLRWSVTGE